jgi:bud site selection protein 31
LCCVLILRPCLLLLPHAAQFDWLCREKIADGPLIAKWRKPGYEILCSMLAIQKGNHNFGTTSHCRVPLRVRAGQQRVTPDVQTGCISCASGDGKFGGPIWWNTPLDDSEAAAEGEEANRSTWAPAGGGGGGAAAAAAAAGGGGRKRPAGDLDDEDEIPDEVRARLEALKRAA